MPCRWATASWMSRYLCCPARDSAACRVPNPLSVFDRQHRHTAGGDVPGDGPVEALDVAEEVAAAPWKYTTAEPGLVSALVYQRIRISAPLAAVAYRSLVSTSSGKGCAKPDAARIGSQKARRPSTSWRGGWNAAAPP